MASRGEVADENPNPAAAGRGSFDWALEAPKFCQPRPSPERPPGLSIPVVVPPPRRQKPVELVPFVFAIFSLCVAVLQPLTTILLLC